MLPRYESSINMGRFDLDSYETVEARLVRFWTDHPEGRILTKLEFHDERRFIVYAEIYFDREDTTPVATGYAEEIVGASPVNKTSALENAETSAIGRGLANCGYAGGKRPSREEMEKVERYEKEPRKSSAPTRLPTKAESERITKLLEDLAFVNDKDTLRAIWNTEKDLLDLRVDNTTLKDALNARVAELA